MPCIDRRRGLAGALVLGLGLAACQPRPAPKPETHTIVIDQMAYGPALTQARVGDTLVFVNRDILKHTATDRGQAFDFDLEPGARAQTRLATPGRVRVYCRYHPGMSAEVEVAGT